MKKKRNITAVLICSLTLVIAGCAPMSTASFNIFSFLRGLFTQKIEYPLISYSNYCGGGMTGGSDDLTVKLKDDGRVLCTYYETEWYDSPAEVSEYYLDAKVLSDIKDVFDEYKMQKWEDLAESEEYVLDAPTESWHFVFGDYDESVSFNEYKKFPKNAYEGLKKINDIIADYAKKADKLPALVYDVADLDDEELYQRLWVKEGEADLLIESYYDLTIHYIILNGLDKDIDVEEDAVLYLVDKKDTKIDIEDSSYGSVTAGYEERFSLKVDEPLKAGKYRLEIAGLSCNFEIK